MPFAHAMPTISLLDNSLRRQLNAMSTGVGPIRVPSADICREAGVAMRAALERISVGPINDPLADHKREIGAAIRNSMPLLRIGSLHHLCQVGAPRSVR